MFRTLRSKLMASYVGLVVLTLVLSCIAAAVIITRVEREASLSRMQVTVQAIAQRLAVSASTDQNDANLVERLAYEARVMHGRTLLLSVRGEIVADPGYDNAYVGQRVALPASRLMVRGILTSAVRFTAEDGQEYWIIFVDAPGASAVVRYVGLALPITEVDPPWGELVDPLSLIGSAVVGVAILLAFVFARSLTRPIASMTAAAQGIAKGHYAQQIGTQGKDEMGRLAVAFDHMAREVERTQLAQRDFLANITHDLRTPLTSIQGFAQAMLDGSIKTPEGFQRASKIIYAESDRMNQLVQDLLDLARLEAAGLDDRQVVPMSEFLQELVQNSQHLATQRNGHVQTAIATDLPAIKADPLRLMRALSNLVDNALKYSGDDATIRIDATYLNRQSPRPEEFAVAFGAPVSSGDWVMIVFSNAGEAIAPEELARVFERFYRGDKSRKQTQGSGLGLAIAREIILAHDGRIEAASDADLGTRIRVWLPCASATSSQF